MDTPATVPALQADLSTLIRRYNGGARDLLPTIAERVVDLRERMNDLRGATREYQDTLIAAYDDAGVSREDRRRIQAAVRYHVDRVQRARLSEEDQQALGLIPGTNAERKRKQRESVQAALAASGFTPGSLHDDPLASLALAVKLLEAVEAAPSLRRLDLVHRAAAKALLESVIKHAESAARLAERGETA
jgi:hypothetical protein